MIRADVTGEAGFNPSHPLSRKCNAPRFEGSLDGIESVIKHLLGVCDLAIEDGGKDLLIGSPMEKACCGSGVRARRFHTD